MSRHGGGGVTGAFLWHSDRWGCRLQSINPSGYRKAVLVADWAVALPSAVVLGNTGQLEHRALLVRMLT